MSKPHKISLLKFKNQYTKIVEKLMQYSYKISMNK